MSTLSEAIPNRIRAMRMERGWSLAELAERANTTAPQIMKLERSQRRIDLEWINRLAAAFGIPEVVLLGHTDAATAVRMLPFVGLIAAGNWREAVEQPLGVTAVPDFLSGGPDAFILQPDGDSMDKVLPPGGFVVVDPRDADLRDGKIYAIMNAEGEATVKRYRADPSRLEPCSNNPAHQSISIGREPFTVIGRVVSSFAPL